MRNWFSTIDNSRNYPSANKVWIAYNQFYDDITKILTIKDFTTLEIENMPMSEFIKFSKDWVATFSS